MSTRGIMGLRIDGQDKLAYNHSDSYPEGLGANIVSSVKALLADDWNGMKNLREKARAIRLVQEKDEPTDEDIAALRQYTNTGVGERRSRPDWYQLLRGTQGDLGATLNTAVMIDNSSYIKDGGCCWAYIVNLDTEEFEVYQASYTEKHHKGRYASATPDRYGHYPCALVATFDLRHIPDDWIKQVEPPDGEDQ